MSMLDRRSIAAVLAGFAVLLLRSALPAQAQGVPVIDQAGLSQAIANVNAATQQVQQLTSMLNQVQTISSTLGHGGTPAWLVNAVSGGLSSSAQTTYANLQSMAAADKQAAVTIQNILSSSGSPGFGTASADFSSFSTSLNWVQGQLGAPTVPNLSAINATRAARTSLASQAAVSAYALALTTRQQAPQTAARVQGLTQQASASTDLRGDVEANTAIMVAIHDELTQIEALMAALLKVEAAGNLALTDPANANTASTSP